MNPLRKLINYLEHGQIAVLGLYLLLAFLVFWKLFFLPETQRFYISSDFISYWDNLYHLISAPFQEWLWDPYQYLGTPLLARIDLGLFYPPLTLWLLISKLLGLSPFGFYFALEIYGVLMLGLAAFFTYLLVRQWTTQPMSAFAGGLIYGFSGYLIASVNTLPVINAAVWLPVLAGMLHKFTKTSKKRYLIYGSLALALTYLAGMPQITLYGLIFSAFFIGWQTGWSQALSVKAKLLAWGKSLFILTLVTGLIIAAPLIIQLKTSLNSNRGQMSYVNTASQGVIKPLHLLDFLLPHWFASPNNHDPNLYSQNYVGILGVIAMLMFPFIYPLGQIYFPYFAAVLFLLLGLGGESLLHDLTYLMIPGVNLFRNIVKYELFINLCVAVVGGLWVDHLYRTANLSKRELFLIGQSIIITLLLAGWLIAIPFWGLTSAASLIPPDVNKLTHFNHQLGVIILQTLLLVINLVLIWVTRRTRHKFMLVTIMVGVLFLDLARFNTKLPQNNSPTNPEKLYGPKAYTRFIKADGEDYRVSYALSPFPENYVPEIVKIENTNGYASVIPNEANQLIQLRNKYNGQQGYAQLSGLMNQKYLLVNEDFLWPGYQSVFTYPVGADETKDYFCHDGQKGWVTCPPGKRFQVFQNQHYLPRVVVLKQPKLIIENQPDKQLAALEQLLSTQPEIDFQTTIVISEEDQLPPKTAQWLYFRQPVYQAKVTAQAGDVLWLSYPSISPMMVKVNDQVAPIRRANYAFMGYLFPSGTSSETEHQVKVYQYYSL